MKIRVHQEVTAIVEAGKMMRGEIFKMYFGGKADSTPSKQMDEHHNRRGCFLSEPRSKAGGWGFDWGGSKGCLQSIYVFKLYSK